MHARMIHSPSGKLSPIPYGKKGQVGFLNPQMLECKLQTGKSCQESEGFSAQNMSV